MTLVSLRELCGTRAGDKGDIADISLFAYDESVYSQICEQVTVERVKHLFAGIAYGAVRRYEVPNLLALKFVLESALGGGASQSLRSDNLGKTLGGALLRLAIDVPDDVSFTRKPRPVVPRNDPRTPGRKSERTL